MGARSFTTKELIGLGEAQSLEFKKSVLLKEALASLCAMVNADSGYGMVVLGVDPTHVVCGLGETNLDKLQQTLSDLARQKFDPRLHLEMDPALCEGKAILLISARRLKDIAYHEYDGRAYIREGSVSRQLSVSEKQRLSLSRNRDLHNGPWRCDKCGSTTGMLVSVSISVPGVMRKSYAHKCGGEWWPAT